AVLTAGAAYLPIDPGYPADRLEFMIGDARPVLAVTTSAVAGSLAEHGVPVLVLDDQDTAARIAAHPAGEVSDADRTAPLHIAHPAYVIYTSGSTGRPKGVVVSHRGIGNVAAAHID